MAEMILQMIVFGLISPVIALPAFLFGWMVRQWWLVPLGAVAIAAVFLVLSLMDSAVPKGGEIVWAAVPVTLLAPLAWCIAGFYFGRWRRGRHGGSEAAGVVRAASIIAGLLLGAALGAAAGLGLGQAYVMLARVSSFEGLAGYVVVFLFMLPGLVIGAIGGAVIGDLVNRRRAGRHMTAA
jgi:hypothetical protein